MENNGTYLKTDESKMKEFSSGAKREDKTGKGRYDLIPGDVMKMFEDFICTNYFENGPATCCESDVSLSTYFDDWDNIEKYYHFIFNMICHFFIPYGCKENVDTIKGEETYEITPDVWRAGLYVMRNALAKHYEEGAKVHGIDNWKKGLPVYGSDQGGCFLDSMRRHADQALQGKDDEPHAVAAVWNAFGAIWTLKHKPHVVMYQNCSAVKAGRNDQVDSLASSLGFMFTADGDKWRYNGADKITAKEPEPKAEDSTEHYITLPSGRKVRIQFRNLEYLPPNIMDAEFLHAIGLSRDEIELILKDDNNLDPAKEYNDWVDALRDSCDYPETDSAHKQSTHQVGAVSDYPTKNSLKEAVNELMNEDS